MSGDWRDRAACLGCDTNLWYGERGGDYTVSRQSKAVCFACPVRQQCLDYAIDNNEEYGIWGGLSETERRAFKRATRVAS